jgi:hypothetical protein
MPSEPDNKTEELLKAYAKKRREVAGAPLELHPATRRLLQTEVARRYPKSGRESRTWLSALAQLWPRIGFALSILLALGFVIWMVLPKANPLGPLAQTQPKAEPAFSIYGKESKDLPKESDTEPPSGRERTLSGAKPMAASGLVTNAIRRAPESKLARGEKPAVAYDFFDSARDDAIRSNTRSSENSDPAKNSQPALKQQKETLNLELAKSSSDKSGVAPSRGAAPDSVQRLLTLDEKETLNRVDLGDARAVKADNGSLNSNSKKLNESRIKGELAGTSQNVPTNLSYATTVGLGEAVNHSAQTNSSLIDFDLSHFAVEGYQLTPSGGASTSSLSLAANYADDLSTHAQRFSRFSGNNKRSFARLPSDDQSILTEFEFEQTGNRIRIVDADGSVYEGQLVANDGARKTGQFGEVGVEAQSETKLKDAQTQRAKSPAPSQPLVEESLSEPGLSFHVSGTSRRLNRTVVIDGRLTPLAAYGVDANSPVVTGRGPAAPAPTVSSAPVIQPPPPASVPAKSSAVVTQSGLAAQASAQPATAASPKITGKLRIGGASEVEFNAIGVAR